jgi:hypothetical protein
VKSKHDGKAAVLSARTMARALVAMVEDLGGDAVGVKVEALSEAQEIINEKIGGYVIDGSTKEGGRGRDQRGAGRGGARRDARGRGDH